MKHLLLPALFAVSSCAFADANSAAQKLGGAFDASTGSVVVKINKALDVAAIAELLSRHVLSRAATDQEITVLKRELDRALTHYRAHPEDATKFLHLGQTPPDAKVSLSELAAYTVIASLMLNLDESITHE